MVKEQGMDAQIDQKLMENCVEDHGKYNLLLVDVVSVVGVAAPQMCFY